MKKINKNSLVHLVFFVFIKPQDYCTELKKLDSIIDWVYRKVCVNFPIYSSGVILRRFIECLRLRTPPTFSTFSSCSLLRAGAFSLFKLITLGSSYHCVIIRASRAQVYINKVSLKPSPSSASSEPSSRKPAGIFAKM